MVSLNIAQAATLSTYTCSHWAILSSRCTHCRSDSLNHSQCRPPSLFSVWLLLSVRDGLLAGTWTDASDNEVLLRQFDLDYTYGPCGGLSRKER